MYQSPSHSGGGQWGDNNNNPPSSQPPQWSPQPPPPNGTYPPRPQNQIPPISQAIQQQPAMATMQPPHPDQYRALPAPAQMYAPPYPGHPPMPYAPQPAPRQRTAIACRYCRRRKIRCSGFDQSEDGRCTNCQRFSQECVFTPVHAHTQAFVPAHTVWRGQNPPPNTQLYGAFGQPLPPNGDNRNQPYPPPPAGQYPPPPQGYQQPPSMYQTQPPQPQPGQKRGTDEPHTPTLPPPNPGAQAQMGQDGQPFTYPAPPGMPAAEQGDTSNGAAADGVGKAESVVSTKSYGVDVGVQTDDYLLTAAIAAKQPES